MPSVKMHRVLITGAGGASAAACARHCAASIQSCASPTWCRSPRRATARRSTRPTLPTWKSVERMVQGCDGIIHLGGISGENTWEKILEGNIVGLYNTFEAARKAGVKRIVMATSNHAVGFYPRSQTIDHQVTVRPDSRYGVSKAFSEALASLYSDKHGMGFLCVRIGNYGTHPIDSRRLSIWVSPRDLTQLVRIGLEHPDVRYEIVYGVSGNQRSWYDNSNAYRLGYQPEDDSEPQAAQVFPPKPASRKTGSPKNTRVVPSPRRNTTPPRSVSDPRSWSICAGRTPFWRCGFTPTTARCAGNSGRMANCPTHSPMSRATGRTGW